MATFGNGLFNVMKMVMLLIISQILKVIHIVYIMNVQLMLFTMMCQDISVHVVIWTNSNVGGVFKT